MCGYNHSKRYMISFAPVNAYAACKGGLGYLDGTEPRPSSGSNQQVCTCSKCYCKVVTNAPICWQASVSPSCFSLHRFVLIQLTRRQCSRGHHAFPLKH